MIAAYGGISATSPVPSVINAMESVSDALRPLRSLNEPSTSAPTGRAMITTARKVPERQQKRHGLVVSRKEQPR